MVENRLLLVRPPPMLETPVRVPLGAGRVRPQGLHMQLTEHIMHNAKNQSLQSIPYNTILLQDIVLQIYQLKSHHFLACTFAVYLVSGLRNSVSLYPSSGFYFYGLSASRSGVCRYEGVLCLCVFMLVCLCQMQLCWTYWVCVKGTTGVIYLN